MLDEYSYIWLEDKEKYFLIRDEFGDSIFSTNGKELMFLLIEDEKLMENIVSKMVEHGNKMYQSFAELQKEVSSL